MAGNDLVFMTAQELGDLVRTRKASSVEVTRAFLARIDKLNPKVNAFITVLHDHGLARAREADREIAAGHYRGPLHGLPYAPKDILATKGIRTTNGSKVTPDWVPPYESTATARLNEAGAVLVGKLNLLEFAMGSGVDSGFGPARNPWDLAYSPSGSSSGSGAALAANMIPLSIGTDTGGSIRGPSSFCGIVGFKATYGRVSRFGVTTLSWTLDNAGPMTRTAADNALMLRVIAGADPKDATAAHEPVPDYREIMDRGVRGLRIGVPTNYFFDHVKPEQLAAARQAIKQLHELGATIVDVSVPHADLAGSAGWIIAMAEGACFHEQRLKTKAALFDPLIRERMEAATFYPATDYIKAQRIRTILMREMETVFEHCDVMAVPGNGPATKLESPQVAASDVKPGSRSPRYRGGNTMIGDMVGMPGLMIPCGFTTGSPTLPLSIQFYGKPFNEATIYRVAQAYQRVTDWHKRHAPVTYGGSSSRR